MRRDSRGRRRKLRRNPAYTTSASNHLNEIKDAFIDHGLNMMDEIVDRLLNQFFTGPQRQPQQPHIQPPRSSKPHKPPKADRDQPQTLYDVLQVSPSASQEVIDVAWKALCKRHHPDRPGGDLEAIKRINAAHDILSNPSHRKKYDRLIGLRK